jgi:hypothetical protein
MPLLQDVAIVTYSSPSSALSNRPSCVRDYADYLDHTGPVTDYGSTLLHWIRNRQPRWKGAYHGEMERPSPSYIVDVSQCSNVSVDLTSARDLTEW